MAEAQGEGVIHLTIEKTSKDGTVTRYEGTQESGTSVIRWIRKVITHGTRDSNERG